MSYNFIYVICIYANKRIEERRKEEGRGKKGDVPMQNTM